MLANTLALAEAGGYRPGFVTRFPDAAVARLVGADGNAGVPARHRRPGPWRARDRPRRRGGDRRHRRGAGRVSPLVTLAQHAGDSERLGEPWPTAPAVEGDLPATDDLDTVILRRGSARTLDATAEVDWRTFERSLAVSLRGTRATHFVAVHAVEGLEPGLYRWPELERPVRRGSLRDELWAACYGQDLGRDASFVVIGAVDLDGLDDGGYREAQLDAGIVEGRLHLAAYALGLGASGMTFLDSEIAALLGEPLAALLFTCVGVPHHRTRVPARRAIRPT